jgi:ankyrin repeat protein
MQKNSAIFLWLTVIGTVTGEPTPPASNHSYHPPIYVSPPKKLLARATLTLVRKASKTLRRKSSSSKAAKRTDTAFTISPEKRGSGELYANFPLARRQESDYLMLHDLRPQPVIDHPDVYDNIPGSAIQDDLAEELRHALNIDNISGAWQLIAQGANPNEQSENNGTTLLSIAAQQGNVSLVQWLLNEKKADPNIASHSKRTPLHQAALFNKNKVAFLLIKAGACKHDADKYGNTPIDFATQRNNKELMDILSANATRSGTENE